MGRVSRCAARSSFQARSLGNVEGVSGLIVVAVLVVVIFGLAYGLYTRRGSGVNQHPTSDARDPVLGDETKTRTESGGEDQLATGVDRTESSEMDQRGTR